MIFDRNFTLITSVQYVPPIIRRRFLFKDGDSPEINETRCSSFYDETVCFDDQRNLANSGKWTPNTTYSGVNFGESTTSVFQVPNVSHDFGGIQYYPYFLMCGDNPGTSIIFEVPNGSKYNTWSIANIALDAKKKIAFIDGSLARPIESDRQYRI